MKGKSFLLATWMAVFAVPALADPPLDEGKIIFTSRCASCHNVNKKLTGPALAGITERRSADWIVGFVKSSQTMVKKGDKDAVALYEAFNKIPMPDHTDLSDENIKNIIEYVNAETKTADIESAAFSIPTKRKPNYVPLSIERDYDFFISYFGVVIMLIAAMLLAVHVETLKTKGQ